MTNGSTKIRLKNKIKTQSFLSAITAVIKVTDTQDKRLYNTSKKIIY